jgi:glycosyltransferase involved in cell wall biosynthesis
MGYKNEIMQNIVPIKMYEYMAMGKPVIATRLSGLVKEFGEGNGVIYIERAEEVLLRTNELNKNSISKEGLRSLEHVSHNNWNKLICEFERILAGIHR